MKKSHFLLHLAASVTVLHSAEAVPDGQGSYLLIPQQEHDLPERATIRARQAGRETIVGSGDLSGACKCKIFTNLKFKSDLTTWVETVEG